MKDVLSDEYLSWIESYSSIKKRIYSIPLGTTKKEILQIEELFKRIDSYVKDNYLYDEEYYGEKYYYKYNGIIYEIGVMYGPDIIYYVNRIDIKEISNCIDINDIRNNIVSNGKDLSKRMTLIKQTLSDMASIGIPLELVNKDINSHIMKLSLKQNKNNR